MVTLESLVLMVNKKFNEGGKIKSRISFVLFFKMGERTTCLYAFWNVYIPENKKLMMQGRNCYEASEYQ